MDQTTAEQDNDWQARFGTNTARTGQANMDRVEAVAKLRKLLDRIGTDDEPTFEEFEKVYAEYRAALPDGTESTLEGAMIDIEQDRLDETLARLRHGEENNGHDRRKQ